MTMILQRSIAANGKIIGYFHNNSELNSLVCDVEFPDVEVKEYADNVLSENTLSQVDNEGFTLTLLNSILNFKQYDQAVSKDDQYATTKRGSRRLRKTTCGWKLLTQMK